MTFLSRRVDESVMIGDSLRVRVVGIHGDHVVLGVGYRDASGRFGGERTCSLECDDRLELPAETIVHVMHIRADRVRLGIEAAAEQSITRFELRADAPRPPGKPASTPASRAAAASADERKESASPKPTRAKSPGKRHRTHHVVFGRDGVIKLGSNIAITVTDADASGVRLMIDGELVGGPDDGLKIREARELAVGHSLPLGNQITIILERAEPGRATLAITVPSHFEVA